ncbi:hypothetical protein BGX34_003469 [Mortierella sp. NVP85]|nr:hypothetical protein BGX34_003469 [Mortierella sp. NVP85]
MQPIAPPYMIAFRDPHLQKMVCDLLAPGDIKSLAMCCKDWNLAFSPYCFQSLHLGLQNIHAATFLLENGYTIRKLHLGLEDFQILNDYRFNDLQELTIAVSFMIQIESEERPRGPNQEQVDGTREIIRNVFAPNHLKYAANLIKKSRSLRTLRIVHGSGIDPVWMNIAGDYVEPFLRVIASHSFLTSIKISVELTCVAFAKFLRNIPHQLQQLELTSNVKNVSYHRGHRSCNTHSRVMELNPTGLEIRRLVFEGEMPCFVDRTLIPLLRRCPELQELTLPFIYSMDAHFDIHELARVLDSNCLALHTLHHGYPPNWSRRFDCDPSAVQLMDTLLRGFSRGFRQLSVYNLYCFDEDFDSLWNDYRVLSTLSTSATFNTLEVLILSPGHGNSDEMIEILAYCPRLREFRVDRRTGGNNSVVVIDLWESMKTPWRCWETLQILELEITAHETELSGLPDEGVSDWAMTQVARTLCSRLSLLPGLKFVCVFWWMEPRGDGDPASLITLERTSSEIVVREENTVGEIDPFDYMITDFETRSVKAG